MLLKKRPHTEQVTEEAIAERAYTLWQTRGCPAGDGQNDWQDAKTQLAAEATPRHKPLRRLFSRFRSHAAQA
ncbi:MAG: DUF2934 domain-containing protein [Planctomycetes bacterium]|nr:DUF2934 domain-containing protein [Planctomycetota bacterium]